MAPKRDTVQVRMDREIAADIALIAASKQMEAKEYLTLLAIQAIEREMPSVSKIANERVQANRAKREAAPKSSGG